MALRGTIAAVLLVGVSCPGVGVAEDHDLIDPFAMPAFGPAVTQLGMYRVADIKNNVDNESRFVSDCRNLPEGREAAEDCGTLVWAVKSADQIALFDAYSALLEMARDGRTAPRELESFGIGGPGCRQIIDYEDARDGLLTSSFCRAFKVDQARINRERLMRRRLSTKELRANDIFYFDEGMNLLSSAITTIGTGFMFFGANEAAVRVIAPKDDPKPAKIRVMNYLRSSGLALFMIPYSMQIEHDYYLERVGD